MKRLISAILCMLLLITAASFTGCGKNDTPETLKLGLGVYTDVSDATDADGDTNGKGSAAITAAVVTVDADGKIVSCVLDTAEIEVAYTSEGKAIANTSFATKGELGDAYGMKAHGNATKEWFEQRDAFQTVVKGKTLDQVKALVAEGNKGTDEVTNAGCTMKINEFVLAIEKAYNNAAASDATAENTLKLGTYTEQDTTDATEDKNGENQTETTFFAAAVDADGKVIAANSECVQITFTFDNTGKSTYDKSETVQGKRERGDAYGMKKYGAAKEWFEQADAFNAACIGKTASEIGGLMGADSYGNADVKAAGCTILVNGFVKAAAKIG